MFLKIKVKEPFLAICPLIQPLRSIYYVPWGHFCSGPHFAEKEILSPLLPDQKLPAPLFYSSTLKLGPKAETQGGNYVDSFPSRYFSAAPLSISWLLRGFPWWLRQQRIACDVRDQVWSLDNKEFPGEGNGYPFQYSCPENSTDRGTWQAIVHGVTVLDTIEWKMLFFSLFKRLSKILCESPDFLNIGESSLPWFWENMC